MKLSGARKAALLLMNLDAPTAAELLKSTQPDMMTQIATELTCLTTQQEGKAQAGQAAREFFALLRKQGSTPDKEQFVRQLVEQTVGPADFKRVMSEVRDRVEQKDPFRDVVRADVADIRQALEGESPQVAAVVLSELPASRSAQLLGMLDGATRAGALEQMSRGEEVSPQVRLRIARMMRLRIDALTQSAQPQAVKKDRGDRLRKVAVLLRGMAQSMRDELLEKLAASDSAVAAEVRKLMVTWEDLPAVADRPLQEVLRKANVKALAIALTGGEQSLIDKVRNNMSERALAMLDEEVSLLSASKPDEVAEARESVLGPLRELNAQGELTWDQADG